MAASSNQQQLYEAIAQNDHEALLQLYGQAAVEALVNYNPSVQRNGGIDTDTSSPDAREEKMDEFFSALTRSSPESSPIRRYIGGKSQQPNHQHAFAELLREFTIFLNHPQLQLEKDAAAVKPVSAAADRLVRDAVGALSDSRPPVHFVLYPGGRVVHNHDEQLQQRQQQQQQQQGGGGDSSAPAPQQPIFDGAVANATPAVGSTLGGGLGTALHAAVALDHPLLLALLLAMGADGRACHTAFRRLVLHEAACNGSTQCLRLLLELGQKFGRELTSSKSSSSASSAADRQHLQQTPAPPQQSPDSVRDFAFFPRRTVAANLAPKQLWPSKKNAAAAAAVVETVEPGSDILSLLRQFRACAQQVVHCQVTELEAARRLVHQAPFSETTQQALAKMCGFSFPHAVTVSLMRSTYLTSHSSSSSRSNNNSGNNNSSADGHGNTPLHWAAFKNESATVELLLEYGSDPNARAHPSGWTPLHDAAYSNGAAAIDLLVAAGAAVDARANSGATPLCFAAQEDSSEAASLLLDRGADLRARCCAPSTSTVQPDAGTTTVVTPTPSSRFSGYTPLHYCAHYNAHRAAVVLLRHPSAQEAMEIADLNDRLPIHVAVARGSSDVLRELLRAGARVETRGVSARSHHHSQSPTRSVARAASLPLPRVRSAPSSPRAAQQPRQQQQRSPPATPPRVGARGRVSSPVLRSLIPSQPVQSSKPWNCLSQRSIDECRDLIQTVEQNWAPDRHSLFTPADRRAVAELLRVGKRLELDGSVQFTYLWPEVLSFCGRGWFEVDETTSTKSATEEEDTTEIEFLGDSAEADDGNDNLVLPTLL